MILGRVVGHVWATQKDARLEGRKLLIVRPYGMYDPTHTIDHLVAVDNLEAGVGDDVLLCTGSPARWTLGGCTLPVDIAVAAIVDHVHFESHLGEARTSDRGLRARSFRFTAGKAPEKVEWR